MMSTLLHDVRYALRTMRRRPLFTATAVLTLALGIGATTSMFTIVHGVLLSPLPYGSPDELVHIQGTRNGDAFATVSYPDLVDLRDGNGSFAAVAAWQPWDVTLEEADGTMTRVPAASVSANFFDLLHATASVGRFFDPSEEELGHDPGI